MAPYAHSQDLQTLIGRLQRAEKRHLRAGLKSGTRLRTLFDALDRWPGGTDAAFLARHPDQRPQYAYWKHRLFRTLLDGLAAYHREHTATARLRQTLQELEVLFHKRLYRSAEALALRGEALAADADEPVYGYLFGRWRYRIRKYGADPSESEEDRFGLHRANRASLEDALAVERQLDVTDRLLFALRRRGPVRSREEEARLDAVMRDPLLAEGAMPASREARVQYHFARATYHFARGDWTSCDGEMDHVLGEMEADPERLRWRLEEYLVRCNSSFMIWRRTGRHDRTIRQLERLEAMDFRDQPHRDALEAHRFRICLANRLYLYEDTGRHREAVALVPALLEGLDRHGPFLTVTNRIGLYLQLAVHEQRLGHLDEAINWTNRYLDEEAGCMRTDKHGHVRLFKIILHYEAGHRDLLPYLIIATWRHFRRMERLFALERLVLHALRYRFLRARTPAEERQAMADTLAELDTLLADPRERVALEHVDFRDWLAGRLEGRYPAKASPDG